MIFEVSYQDNKGKFGSTFFSGSGDAFCEQLKKIFRKKEWRVYLISVKEEVVLVDEI